MCLLARRLMAQLFVGMLSKRTHLRFTSVNLAEASGAVPELLQLITFKAILMHSGAPRIATLRPELAPNIHTLRLLSAWE